MTYYLLRARDRNSIDTNRLNRAIEQLQKEIPGTRAHVQVTSSAIQVKPLDNRPLARELVECIQRHLSAIGLPPTQFLLN